MQTEGLTIRAADEHDVMAIHELLTVYAQQQLLLGRSPDDIRYHLKNFVVAELDGRTVACCALRNFGSSLYEVRSLAVTESCFGRGIGSSVVRFLVDSMQSQRPCRIFALTYHPNLFVRLGFKSVSKELFPPKIWCDCSSCPKKEHCDEEAVLLELD